MTSPLTDPPRSLPRRFPARVVVALTTPCCQPGVVDPPALRRLCALLASKGCDGLFALSSTGEMVLVDEDDRRELVTAAREGTPENTCLLVGVGGFGVKQVVRLSRLAARDGADAAVVMAPFFQRLSQAELIGEIERIADDSPIPICVYHHLRMPTAFDVDSVARLSLHPNIVAYKDTSTDLDRMHNLVAAVSGSDLSLLQGSERLILPSLTAGADGCISALAGIAPEWHRQLIDAFLADQIAHAEKAQQKLNRLLNLFLLPQVKSSLAHFVHTIKYASVSRGWMHSSASLLGGFEPSVEFNDAILAALADAGLPCEALPAQSPA